MKLVWKTRMYLSVVAVLGWSSQAAAQQHEHGARRDTTQQHQHAPADTAKTMQHAGMKHEMPMLNLPGGWMLIGMGQFYPTGTASLPTDAGTPLERSGLYVTQPALMTNLESRNSTISLRTTLNFEGITQPWGELSFGDWGEGFIDKRHPHTFLHEAMLSANFWSSDGGGFSISAGKGFAPYGTDDPMSRPVIKYPTNHHLSQILERFTLNAVYASPLWAVEAGVFGGDEPDGPWDFSNISSFANSWSARVSRHFGTGDMHIYPWEVAGSFARVKEHFEDGDRSVWLYNVFARHEKDYPVGHVYGLAEVSWSTGSENNSYYSVLAEASIEQGPHKPYARLEYATRPEFVRDGPPNTTGFFRYDHDAEPIGATRWFIVTGGYGYTATGLPYSARPYLEVQWNNIGEDRGGITPEMLYGRSSFFSVSAGFRVFLGAEPMRMGAYGVLDAMTLMHRMDMVHAEHRSNE